MSRYPGFDSRRDKIFWEVVGLERGPLSLVSTTEEILGRNGSSYGLENREYGSGDPLRWPRNTLYLRKLVLTSPTCGGHLVGVVRLRTKATDVVCLFVCLFVWLHDTRERHLKYTSLYGQSTSFVAWDLLKSLLCHASTSSILWKVEFKCLYNSSCLNMEPLSA
jgi:hypothetical protein